MPFEFKLDKKARDVFTDYANGKPIAGMAFINSYEDGKQSVLTKVMTPLTSILKNQYGYSIFVVVDTITADELTKYDTMGQRLIPNGLTYKKLLNDDPNPKMYLKLKVKDDEFEALNFTTPDEYESVNLEGINLNVTFHMGIWLNFEKQTAGSFLKIVSITKA